MGWKDSDSVRCKENICGARKSGGGDRNEWKGRPQMKWMDSAVNR